MKSTLKLTFNSAGKYKFKRKFSLKISWKSCSKFFESTKKWKLFVEDAFGSDEDSDDPMRISKTHLKMTSSANVRKVNGKFHQRI